MQLSSENPPSPGLLFCNWVPGPLSFLVKGTHTPSLISGLCEAVAGRPFVQSWLSQNRWQCQAFLGSRQMPGSEPSISWRRSVQARPWPITALRFLHLRLGI